MLRGVAQMGARVVWDHEVAGSIPVTPTSLTKRNSSRMRIFNWLNKRFKISNMRVSYIGNTPAFQAGKVGSIPTTRSIRKDNR